MQHAMEGIDTIVIERPRLAFPQNYSSIDEVVKLVKKSGKYLEISENETEVTQ